MSQSIEMFDMNNNKGIIGLNLAEARIINNYKKLVHIIELDDFKISLLNIRHNIRILETTIRDKKLSEHQLIVARNRYKIMEDELNNILPIIRSKRGLWTRGYIHKINLRKPR